MAAKKTDTTKRRAFAPTKTEEHPLLRTLIAEATRRHDTLAALAQALGVTYERLAQWRRGEGDISRASRRVLEAAGAYLRVPFVFVLCLAGTIKLLDFVQPARATLAVHTREQLARLRVDPHLGGFYPDALDAAHPSVQHLVAFLYLEVAGSKDIGADNYRWMQALHRAALGNIEAQAELAATTRPPA